MALLRKLSRSALICNICFLLAIGLLKYKPPVNPGLTSLIIVMGFVLAVLLNLVVNIWALISKIRRRSLSELPVWLMYTNGIFLVIQIILFSL